MTTILNNFKTQDTATKIGLGFVITFILPLITFIIYNVITGNFQNF